MANYAGKAATEKCARCSGKGYNIRFREEGVVFMKCHRCEGTGAYEKPMITFTVFEPESR
jgi:DnaJ-class molecular chaperone